MWATLFIFLIDMESIFPIENFKSKSYWYGFDKSD